MALVELLNQSGKNGLKGAGRLILTLLRYYFRVEITGIENIPKRTRALIIPNHSGFVGADAVLLTFLIKRETKRRARLLAHRAYFDFSKTIKEVSESFGLRKASIDAGIHILENDNLLVCFPEGESGNFKSSLSLYRLQPFHTGFLRMALTAKAPIVPCIIIGAEESNLNLGNINLSWLVKGLKIPMPLNFIPLPAKWTISFLPPIMPEEFGDIEKLLSDQELLRRYARRVQRIMQLELRRQLKSRPYVYTKQTGKLADQAREKFLEFLRKWL